MNQNWTEADSSLFIDTGKYFVPDRELQYQTFCDLIPDCDHPFNILEICCGEGLLAKALLSTHPNATVFGYDGSAEMRKTSQNNLKTFGTRFQTRHFDLFETTWRKTDYPVHAIVSSLTIHHLDAAQKQALFHDMFHLLEPLGVFLIADLIQPTHPLGIQHAANAWDRSVQERAQKVDGNLKAFEKFQKTAWNLYRYPEPQTEKPSPLFDQLKWLQQANFQDIDVYWMHAGHAIFGGSKA